MYEAVSRAHTEMLWEIKLYMNEKKMENVRVLFVCFFGVARWRVYGVWYVLGDVSSSCDMCRFFVCLCS